MKRLMSRQGQVINSSIGEYGCIAIFSAFFLSYQVAFNRETCFRLKPPESHLSKGTTDHNLVSHVWSYNSLRAGVAQKHYKALYSPEVV